MKKACLHSNNVKQEITLDVNGFETRAVFSEANLEHIWRPLLKHLFDLCLEQTGRLIVFLAAPPGAGKSTLALWLSELARNTAGAPRVQALGLDGFHFPAAALSRMSIERDGVIIPLAKIKGAPETFNIAELRKQLNALQNTDASWPYYDRNLHDISPVRIPVTGEIVIVEGNWLLLDEPEWRMIKAYCGYSIAIVADETLLESRLIARKVRGGSSIADAVAHYAYSDQPNISRFHARLQPADLMLSMIGDGEYE